MVEHGLGSWTARRADSISNFPVVWEANLRGQGINWLSLTQILEVLLQGKQALNGVDGR